MGPAIGMSSFICGMTGSKGSRIFSTSKLGPAVVWSIIGSWVAMLPISRKSVGSTGCLLGTLWVVVVLVAPGQVGNWQVLARDPDLWHGLLDDFCMF